MHTTLANPSRDLAVHEYNTLNILHWPCPSKLHLIPLNVFIIFIFVFSEEGIEPLLELEDVMSVEVPEPKSLITYVHFIYQHFAEKQQQQKNA